MKTRIKEAIGGAIFFAGLFVAVCTVDGSRHEMRNRLIGLAVCAAGAVVTKKSENDEKEERKTDHEPYPEE